MNYKNDESTDALEVKSPICSPLNSEDNELPDSITTNFSQSNVILWSPDLAPRRRILPEKCRKQVVSCVRD